MYEDLLRKIIPFVLDSHGNQTDKAGEPYINHLRFVAERVRPFGIKYEIVAWCHDVVEDAHITDVSFDDLKKIGLDDELLFAIDCITKRPDEKNNYRAYLNRVLLSEIAVRVKLADLYHNSMVSRLDPTKLTDKDINRFLKYELAIDYLGTKVIVE